MIKGCQLGLQYIGPTDGGLGLCYMISRRTLWRIKAAYVPRRERPSKIGEPMLVMLIAGLVYDFDFLLVSMDGTADLFSFSRMAQD